MEIEAAIPPINLHLDYLRRRAAIRLNRLHSRSQVVHRLPMAWHASTALNPHRPTVPTYQLVMSHSPLCERTDLLGPEALMLEGFKGRLSIQTKGGCQLTVGLHRRVSSL